MPIARTKKLAIAERRRKVAAMYVRSARMVDIASQLNVSIGTVHSDIETLKEEMRAVAVDDIGTQVGIALARIEEIARQAWEGWARSIGPKTTEKERLVESVEHGDTTAIETAVEQQIGNPTFLQTLLKCEERRAKLLGLDDAEKVQVEVEGQMSVQEVAEEVRRDRDLWAVYDARGGDDFPGVVRSGGQRGQLEDGPAPGGEPDGNGDGD